MAQSIVVRVDRLERQVEALETLPERVANLEVQIVQFREEVRGEFSAVRSELRSEMQAQGEQIRTDLRAEIRAEGEQIRSELRAEIRAHGKQIRSELRKEIRDGDEETRRFMRVLHEDVISRLQILQEGQMPGAASGPRGRRARRPKR